MGDNFSFEYEINSELNRLIRDSHIDNYYEWTFNVNIWGKTMDVECFKKTRSGGEYETLKRVVYDYLHRNYGDRYSINVHFRGLSF